MVVAKKEVGPDPSFKDKPYDRPIKGISNQESATVGFGAMDPLFDDSRPVDNSSL